MNTYLAKISDPPPHLVENLKPFEFTGKSIEKIKSYRLKTVTNLERIGKKEKIRFLKITLSHFGLMTIAHHLISSEIFTNSENLIMREEKKISDKNIFIFVN